MKKWILGAIFSTALAACGSGSSYDNVAACEDFVKKVKCGTVDISTQVNCNGYANTACDIAPYFECLSSKYVCTNNMYDTSKLATLGDCTSKATCK